MKRIAAILVLASVAGYAFSQDKAEPQIAYRILSDYVQQKEEDAGKTRAIVGWSLVGVGTVVVAGSATAWATQDLWRASLPVSSDQVTITCLAVAGGGAAAIIGGIVTLAYPHNTMDKEYALIFKEKDPVVQEALAAAALKVSADGARDRRITGAIVGLAVPVVTLVVQSALNVSTNKPWYNGYDSVGAWQVPSIATNISSFFTESSEERLYDKYLAAKSAIYPTE